jgi:predicted nucleotidyltransferase
MNKRQTTLEQICRHFDVALLYSFGSRASQVRDWFEENRDHLPAGLSDADIGVKVLTGKKWSVREKVQLAGALEELLGISRVDLVCLTEADPFVAAEISGKICPRQ